MRKKIWVHTSRSFLEAKTFDDQYYLDMTHQERVETVQYLRETYVKMNKKNAHARGKRLRRVIKVIKQA